MLLLFLFWFESVEVVGRLMKADFSTHFNLFDNSIQLLNAFRIKFRIFAAHAHKDDRINETLKE